MASIHVKVVKDSSRGPYKMAKHLSAVTTEIVPSSFQTGRSAQLVASSNASWQEWNWKVVEVLFAHKLLVFSLLLSDKHLNMIENVLSCFLINVLSDWWIYYADHLNKARKSERKRLPLFWNKQWKCICIQQTLFQCSHQKNCFYRIDLCSFGNSTSPYMRM